MLGLCTGGRRSTTSGLPWGRAVESRARSNDGPQSLASSGTEAKRSSRACVPDQIGSVSRARTLSGEPRRCPVVVTKTSCVNEGEAAGAMINHETRPSVEDPAHTANKNLTYLRVV